MTCIPNGTFHWKTSNTLCIHTKQCSQTTVFANDIHPLNYSAFYQVNLLVVFAYRSKEIGTFPCVTGAANFCNYISTVTFLTCDNSSWGMTCIVSFRKSQNDVFCPFVQKFTPMDCYCIWFSLVSVINCAIFWAVDYTGFDFAWCQNLPFVIDLLLLLTVLCSYITCE